MAISKGPNTMEEISTTIAQKRISDNWQQLRQQLDGCKWQSSQQHLLKCHYPVTFTQRNSVCPRCNSFSCTLSKMGWTSVPTHRGTHPSTFHEARTSSWWTGYLRRIGCCSATEWCCLAGPLGSVARFRSSAGFAQKVEPLNSPPSKFGLHCQRMNKTFLGRRIGTFPASCPRKACARLLWLFCSGYPHHSSHYNSYVRQFSAGHVFFSEAWKTCRYSWVEGQWLTFFFCWFTESRSGRCNTATPY